jgi:hypothetical protein
MAVYIIEKRPQQNLLTIHSNVYVEFDEKELVF